LTLSIGVLWQSNVFAEDPGPPVINSAAIINSQKRIQWNPYPAAVQYKISHSDNLLGPFSEDSSGTMAGYDWTAPLIGSGGFYRLQVVPMSANDLLLSTVLNRLAYGPTPDEIERVKAMRPQAYIDEQLVPELIQENLDIDTVVTNGGWQYVTATGTASSSTLYIYLTSAGEGYIDDIKLVAGTGANLLRNGDFELPLKTNDWTISSNHFGSAIATDIRHSGNSSLHLVANVGGTTRASAIWQDIRPALSTSQQYTLSYWYLPSPNKSVSLTVRLSGSGITSSPGSLLARLDNGSATIDDLRAWHILHAVRSHKQLLEILDQFLENHFVTQYSKSREYFDTYYNDGNLIGQLATQMEFKENQKWRQALLNPKCTFKDLLLISAESPAMIIYLDTVNSRGDAQNIANENYARELLELFTFGVDNGYDQNDITVMSRAWTGWSANIVDATNEFNPLALRTKNIFPGAPAGSTAVSNLVGVWTFNYKQERHKTSSKTIFPGKTVPARFGPPYAGKNYELVLPARTGTNGIQDGYDIVAHLANQPFTQEFISVKLCRLFVHDDFYIGDDFTDPNLSPEGQLVKQCMQAWETSSPKGQIRPVLATIFNSELFRGHGGSLQKVKTPLEFVVSAIRALRTPNPNGTFTADTDGRSLSVQGAALDRMGGMNLFDRAEPDGYTESAGGWISAGTLAERLRFVQALLTAPAQRTAAPAITDAGNSVADPVALIKLKLPATDWSNAAVVVDYFLSILYPGEGKANLDLYRTSAINFLNTLDNGVTPSAFSGLSMAGNPPPYDIRVRGMVAMLLTLQRFQEQ
jgi:uncharacterized protein (DUF1800 family)